MQGMFDFAPAYLSFLFPTDFPSSPYDLATVAFFNFLNLPNMFSS